MRKERWVSATLESFEMGRRLRTAIQHSYRMHKWAMGLLREHWLESMHVLTVNEMQPMMTYWLREQDLEKEVQRYPMDIALSRTILHFNDSLKPLDVRGERGNGEGVMVLLPEEVAEKDWNKLDIQSRQVWRRYLEDYGRLTSKYGTIFLEGNWPQQMREYAKDLKVELEMLPHLWNGVTLREVLPEERKFLPDPKEEDDEIWLVRFNFLRPESAPAKRRTGKGRIYAEE